MASKEKLFNKNYFLLWQGQTISRIGTNIFSVTMVLWLIDSTDKASLLGFMGMLAGIPEVLFSPIGGTLADRFSRRKIIISSDLIKGSLMMCLAAAFYFLSGSENIVIIILLLVTMLSASVNSFFYPAISASIPDIVSKTKLKAANSFSQSSIQIVVMLGQMLGSTLYLLLGAPLVVLINGLSFFYSSASEMFISIPQRITNNSNMNENQTSADRFRRFKEDLKNGLRFIWQKKGLKKLVIISAMQSFFSVPVFLLFPYYLEKVLEISKVWYPYFLAVYLAGNLLGFVLASINFIPEQIKNKLVYIFIFLAASSYGILGLNSSLYIALAVILLSGMMGGFIQITITSIMQITTPSEIRGRVFGFIGTMGASLSPLAMGISGIVADLTNKNIPLIYGTSSIIMLLILSSVLSRKDIQELFVFEKDVLAKADAALKK